MNQSHRTLLTLLLALSLLTIPALLVLKSTFDAGSDRMGSMPGMAGGMPQPVTSPPVGGSPGAGGGYGELAPAALWQALAAKDFVLINVHVPYEGEIAGTDAFIPYDRIGGDTARLPADRGAAIVLYCRTGRMSAEAAATLVSLGYTNVRDLAGGMESWQAQGYPLQELSQR